MSPRREMYVLRIKKDCARCSLHLDTNVLMGITSGDAKNGVTTFGSDEALGTNENVVAASATTISLRSRVGA